MTFLPEPHYPAWLRLWWRVRRWPVIRSVVRIGNRLRWYLYRRLFPEDYRQDQEMCARVAAVFQRDPPLTLFTASADIAAKFYSARMKDTAGFDWYAASTIPITPRKRRAMRDIIRNFLKAY